MVMQNYWNSVSLSNKLKKVGKCTKKWHFSQSLNRRREVTLTSVIIGYSFLTHAILISKGPKMSSKLNHSTHHPRLPRSSKYLKQSINTRQLRGRMKKMTKIP